MNQPLNFEVNYKEHLYFALKAIVSIILYVLILLGIASVFMSETIPRSSVYLILIYVALIIILLFFRFGVLVGYLKGNAVKVTAYQFPDIHEIVNKQSRALGLSSVPDVYILQYGGFLNAFATRFLGTNYIVLFSEIVESANDEDKKVLEFVIGHELGHIKRKHLVKRLLLFPSSLVPFLGFAYSRACEYTCDNIGYALCPEGVKSGLLLLASGKGLFKKVDTLEYVKQIQMERGFWNWFSEKVSSHPHTTKRLAKFRDILTDKVKVGKVTENSITEQPITDDHSKYMPR